MSGYEGEAAVGYDEGGPVRAQKPVRDRPDGIIAQLHELDDAADELDSALARLFDRLTPALRPEDGEEASGDVGAIRPPVSDMRNHAERITAHMRQLRRLTTSITDRVDL